MNKGYGARTQSYNEWLKDHKYYEEHKTLKGKTPKQRAEYIKKINKTRNETINDKAPLAKYRELIDKANKIEENTLDYKQMYIDLDNYLNKNCPYEEQDEIINGAEYKKEIGNTFGYYLQEKMNYNELPELIDEEEFWGKGNTSKDLGGNDSTLLDESRLYRGVVGDKDGSAKDYVEQFKHGNFFAGEGYGANGCYFSKSESEAKMFAEENKDDGAMIYGMLKDNAKIAYVSKMQSIGRRLTREFDWSTMNDEMAEVKYNFKDRIFNDISYTAMLFGYDALDLEDSRIVLLNRGAFKVVK